MGHEGARASDRGAVATEFVLIAPILIMMFFAIFYIGLGMYRTQVLESAAREGARVASLGGDEGQIAAAVLQAATAFNASELTLQQPVDLCTAVDDDTTVVVLADGDRLDFDIPFLGSFEPDYQATATFKCEREV